ncbi:hypothetical protein [Embleya sp. NPDC005971]|uniref:hypothetical protein n=1 Tax=Embleya sp. NPDC005971 TaxID=3156724 RepID=UPI003404A8D0
MSAQGRVSGSTQEDLDKGRAFFERYRHAWCRDAYSGREGVLMDVQGRQVYLRLRVGIEFVCHMRDLVILRPPPPVLHARVAYVGAEDATKRPNGTLMEMWAVDKGTLAVVQPPNGHAWFALLADLERADCPMGPVAEWADPADGSTPDASTKGDHPTGAVQPPSPAPCVTPRAEQRSPEAHLS